MGTGYIFQCKKCKKRYYVNLGVGMMYSKAYRKAIEDAGNGKYGVEWQKMIHSGEYIVINAGKEVYICSSCGHWKSDMNLSLYRPKDEEAIRTEKFGNEDVEKLGYVPYVCSYDFREKYELMKVFVHKCEKCGKRMHKAKRKELEKLPCPRCGTENLTEGIILWD